MKPYPNQSLELMLAVALIIGGTIVSAIGAKFLSTLAGPKYASIHVEGLCCTYTTAAVFRELQKVDGVIDIEPNVRAKTVRVAVRTDRPASAKALWDAIARTSVRPIRLTLNRSSFSERPLE